MSEPVEVATVAAAQQEPVLLRILHAIGDGMNAVGTVWIFALMLLIVADIGGWFLLNAPLPGVTEIVSLSIVGIVFLQLASTLRAGRLTRSDAVLGRWRVTRPRAAQMVELISFGLGATLLTILAHASWPPFVRAWTRDMSARSHLHGTDLAGTPCDPRRQHRAGGAVRRDALAARAACEEGVTHGPVVVGALSLVLMLLLIWLGIHIAIVLMLLSFVGLWLLRGDLAVAERLLALSAYESLNNYLFGVVPLFVQMGLMVATADIGRDAYRVAEQVFRRAKGGLGIATIAANTAFAGGHRHLDRLGRGLHQDRCAGDAARRL